MSKITAFTVALSSTLKDARIAAGVSIAELAAATGVSNTYLQRLESGYRGASLSRVLPIASALGVTAEDLVQGASERIRKALR